MAKQAIGSSQSPEDAPLIESKQQLRERTGRQQASDSSQSLEDAPLIKSELQHRKRTSRQQASGSSQSPEEAFLIESEQEHRERIGRARQATAALFYICFVVTLVVGVVFYRKGKEESYPAIFSSFLCVFSVLYGAFVTRLILVYNEEARLSGRYDRSRTKMFLDCFSGAEWLAVLLVLTVASLGIAFYILTVKPKFQWEYIVLVFSSVGLGPFVSLALQFNKLTRSQEDNTVEERNATVAGVLAWSYYYLHIDNMKNVWNSLENHSETEINLEKIFILIPQDCKVWKDDIHDNRQFRKIQEFKYGKKDDFVGLVELVSVKVGKEERNILVHRPLPLHSMLQMSCSKDGPGLVRNKEREAKLFYEKLKKIMKKMLGMRMRNKYHVVLYNNLRDLVSEIEKCTQAHSAPSIPENMIIQETNGGENYSSDLSDDENRSWDQL